MTDAELAILGLVVEAPRHGYEIEQVIEERGMREWTEVAFSSIYYVLGKLEQAALIESQLAESTGRGPARKTYSVTDTGQAAWHEATMERLAVPRPGYMPLQLGLAGLPGLAPDEAATQLRLYRGRLAERRAHVRARQAAQEPLPRHVQAMFDLSLTMIEAELGWVERFLTALENDPSPVTSAKEI